MKKILLASANPYSFCIAVEHHLAETLGSSAIVDGLDMYKLCARHSAIHYKMASRSIAALNRKYQRFIVPVLSGRDITGSIKLPDEPIPPLPEDPAALKDYKLGEAKIGLGVLSTITTVTTIQEPTSLDEYGPGLHASWRAAHLSARLGEAVKALGYDEIYIFNGRHCYSRPFCDLLESSTRLVRYENAGRLDTYVNVHGPLHDPERFARFVENHDYDRAEGIAFFEDRIRKAPGNDVNFFTSGQVEGHVPADLAGKDIVVFFTSSSDEMYAIKDDFHFGHFQNQFEVAQALKRVCRASGKHLVIRMHPHLAIKHESWQREWNFGELRGAGVTLLDPTSPCDSYALAQKSGCVFTLGSTLGFECSYLGIPNAVIGDWVGSQLGASVSANSEAEMREFVANPTLPPNAREKALLFGSLFRKGGTPMPAFDIGAHLSEARLRGRIVDPVRYAARPLRKLLKI